MANKDRDAALWPYFVRAKTLVHESGHAALIAARNQGSKAQWFFDGCATSEQGYEIEVKLLGGLIKKTTLNGSPVLILADWPSKPDHYMASKLLRSACRRQRTRRRTPAFNCPPSTTRSYRCLLDERVLKRARNAREAWLQRIAASHARRRKLPHSLVHCSSYQCSSRNISTSHSNTPLVLLLCYAFSSIE